MNYFFPSSSSFIALVKMFAFIFICHELFFSPIILIQKYPAMRLFIYIKLMIHHVKSYFIIIITIIVYIPMFFYLF